MSIIGTILILGILTFAVFKFFKSQNPNDNNIIKKMILNILSFILFFVVYYFVIAIISAIPLSMMSNDSGSDSGLWAYSIILGMGISPILSIITITKLNKKKVIEQDNLDTNNNSGLGTIKTTNKFENWCYLFVFIILNFFLSSIVVIESEMNNLLFKIYPFMVLYIPTILLLILNIKKKEENHFKIYIYSGLLIILIPFILNIILTLIDLRDVVLLIKIILSIIADIIIVLKLFNKIELDKMDVSTKEEFTYSVVESKTIDQQASNTKMYDKNKWLKILFLIIFNIVIMYFIVITDFNDWGGIIMGPIITLAILVINPILILIMFRKYKNKGIIVFVSLITTIILSLGANFFGKPDNIDNLIENNKEDKQIENILNDSNNIEMYSNDEFCLYLDINNKKLYTIKNINSDNSIFGVEKNYNLLELSLNEINISNYNFNKDILFTKKFSNSKNNVVLNYKYKTIDNKYDAELVLNINGTYYTVENENWYLTQFLNSNEIIQDKILSIMGREKYETDISLYNMYELYSNEEYDYLIINEIEQSSTYSRQEYNEYKYIESYKCFIGNKTDSERLREYRNHIENLYNYPNFQKNEYFINNGKITKIIVYDLGNDNVWIELFPIGSENSLFISIFNFPTVNNREIR